MGKYSEVFVGIDTAEKKHAVAVADAGRDGETRYLGEIDSAPATVERVIKKVGKQVREGTDLLRSWTNGLSALSADYKVGSRVHCDGAFADCQGGR